MHTDKIKETTVKTITRIINLVHEKSLVSPGYTVNAKITLLLEIILFEIIQKDELEDDTAGALAELNSTIIQSIYKDNYLKISDGLDQLYYSLKPFNKNINTADLEIVGFTNEKWQMFFSKKINQLLTHRS